MQVKTIKSNEGGEAVVLKIQVRKEEILHGMFPVITIGEKPFQMDTFMKKDEGEPTKVSKTKTCLDTGEQDDVSQIHFLSLVTLVINLLTFQHDYLTCHFVLRIRKEQDMITEEPTIYNDDPASVSKVIVMLQVKAGESKEYVIVLYDNNTTIIIVVVVLLTLAIIIIGVIMGIWKVVMRENIVIH